MAKVIADDRVPSPSSQSGRPLPIAYQAFIAIVIVIVVIAIVVIVIVIVVIVIVAIVIASSSLSLLLSVFVLYIHCQLLLVKNYFLQFGVLEVIQVIAFPSIIIIDSLKLLYCVGELGVRGNTCPQKS